MTIGTILLIILILLLLGAVQLGRTVEDGVMDPAVAWGWW